MTMVETIDRERSVKLFQTRGSEQLTSMHRQPARSFHLAPNGRPPTLLRNTKAGLGAKPLFRTPGHPGAGATPAPRRIMKRRRAKARKQVACERRWPPP